MVLRRTPRLSTSETGPISASRPQPSIFPRRRRTSTAPLSRFPRKQTRSTENVVSNRRNTSRRFRPALGNESAASQETPATDRPPSLRPWLDAVRLLKLEPDSWKTWRRRHLDAGAALRTQRAFAGGDDSALEPRVYGYVQPFPYRRLDVESAKPVLKYSA